MNCLEIVSKNTVVFPSKASTSWGVGRSTSHRRNIGGVCSDEDGVNGIQRAWPVLAACVVLITAWADWPKFQTENPDKNSRQ